MFVDSSEKKAHWHRTVSFRIDCSAGPDPSVGLDQFRQTIEKNAALVINWAVQQGDIAQQAADISQVTLIDFD